jgi:hypothetical protein
MGPRVDQAERALSAVLAGVRNRSRLCVESPGSQRPQMTTVAEQCTRGPVLQQR